MRTNDQKQNTLEKFLFTWSARISGSKKARRRRFRRHLAIESLEESRVLATILWTNAAGGDWDSSGNWDLNRVPISTDDVVIPDLGMHGKYLTITFSSGSATVNSIINAETLRVAGGTLIDAGTLAGTGTLIVDGGTLAFSGSNWTNSSTIDLESGTLNLGGSFTMIQLGIFTRLNGTAGTVNVTGTLDLTGTTLVLDTANNGLGTWNLLLGGTITGGIAGGTVRTLNGAALRVTGGILNHLTLGTVNVGTGLSNNDGTV